MKLKEKVSLVTGGGQGIGRAVCLKLADEGADVIVADIDLDNANLVSKEIRKKGRKSTSLPCDVSDSRQVKKMVEETINGFGRIDILVNVAGIAKKSAIEDATEADWDKVIGVNLKGTFLCSQEAGKHMIRQGGGSIVNFGSIAGHTPQVYLSAYSPSKAAVIQLTKIMAVEWAKHKIRVNAVSPGPITTPLTEMIYNTPELKAKRSKAVPMNRFGSPEEVAQAVAFLSSDEASYITGHSLVIDGGSLNGVFYLTGLLSA